MQFILKGRRVPGRPCGVLGSIDEQTFLVNTIKTIQTSPCWKSTAVIIAGSLLPMFDFSQRDKRRLFLDPGTGQPVDGEDEGGNEQ
jgi:hypothetical protein